MTAEPEPETEDAPAARERLGFLRPRGPHAGARTKHHSRMVGWLRFGLPAGALLVLALLVLWPNIQPGRIAAVAVKNIPNLVIQNLHFTGLDSKNQPYSLSAVKATRPGGMHNIYDLDHPEAETMLTDGAWIAGRAVHGRYDQDARKLWLGGDVELFHDKGYQFTTDEAQINLIDNDAWGEKPILIQGGFGEIRGQGFRLLDSGKTMVVTGPARAILDLRAGGGSDKPAPATP